MSKDKSSLILKNEHLIDELKKSISSNENNLKIVDKIKTKIFNLMIKNIVLREKNTYQQQISVIKNDKVSKAREYQTSIVEAKIRFDANTIIKLEEYQKEELQDLDAKKLELLIFKIKTNKARLAIKLKKLNDYFDFMALPKEVQVEKRIDLSFYQSDKLSSLLVMLGIVAQIYYLATILRLVDSSILMGLVVLGNIVILLGLFTATIKLKMYKLFWSIAMFVFAVYQLLRVFLIIPYMLNISFKNYEKLKNIAEDEQVASIIEKNIGYLRNVNIACFVVLAFTTFAAIVSYIKILRQRYYINKGKITFKQMSK